MHTCKVVLFVETYVLYLYFRVKSVKFVPVEENSVPNPINASNHSDANDSGIGLDIPSK